MDEMGYSILKPYRGMDEHFQRVKVCEISKGLCKKNVNSRLVSLQEDLEIGDFRIKYKQFEQSCLSSWKVSEKLSQIPDLMQIIQTLLKKSLTVHPYPCTV